MKAIWKGFSHPGITWKGTVAVNVENFMNLMARGMMTDPTNQPGGDSYAILSKEYLNLSAKFGYHFANLDAFVSDIPDQNYISLQFAGGAGTYYGKSLRLNFLGNVLFIAWVSRSRSPGTSWRPPLPVSTAAPWRTPWTRWAGCWPPAASWTWASPMRPK